MSVGDPRWPRVSPSGAARPSASGRVLRLSRVTRVRGRCERDTRRRSAPTPASRRCGMEICTRRARSGEVTSGPARCGQPASQAENCAAGAPIRGGAVSLLTSRRAMSPTDCWLPRGTPQPARPPLVQRRRRSFPGVGRGAGPDVTPASGAAGWRFAHAALTSQRRGHIGPGRCGQPDRDTMIRIVVFRHGRTGCGRRLEQAGIDISWLCSRLIDSDLVNEAPITKVTVRPYQSRLRAGTSCPASAPKSASIHETTWRGQ
jgi:hypothetical protein